MKIGIDSQNLVLRPCLRTIVAAGRELAIAGHLRDLLNTCIKPSTVGRVPVRVRPVGRRLVSLRTPLALEFSLQPVPGLSTPPCREGGITVMSKNNGFIYLDCCNKSPKKLVDRAFSANTHLNCRPRPPIART